MSKRIKTAIFWTAIALSLFSIKCIFYFAKVFNAEGVFVIERDIVYVIYGLIFIYGLTFITMIMQRMDLNRIYKVCSDTNDMINVNSVIMIEDHEAIQERLKSIDGLEDAIREQVENAIKETLASKREEE